MLSFLLSRPADCSRQLIKLLSIDDDLTKIPQCIKVYLLFLQHIMEILKVSVHVLRKIKLQQLIFSMFWLTHFHCVNHLKRFVFESEVNYRMTC